MHCNLSCGGSGGGSIIIYIYKTCEEKQNILYIPTVMAFAPPAHVAIV